MPDFFEIKEWLGFSLEIWPAILNARRTGL